MTKASVQMPKTLTYCYEIAVAGFIKCSTIKRLITSHLSFARIGAGLEGKKNLSFYLVSCCLFCSFFLFAYVGRGTQRLFPPKYVEKTF